MNGEHRFSGSEDNKMCDYTLKGRQGQEIISSIVLYHPSSGQICHTPRQDPLHSDDDVTQYMWHSHLQYTASHSHPSLLLPSDHLLPSNLLLSELTTCGPHHQLISTSSAEIHVSHDLSPICSLYHCGEKM